MTWLFPRQFVIFSSVLCNFPSTEIMKFIKLAQVRHHVKNPPGKGCILLQDAAPRSQVHRTTSPGENGVLSENRQVVFHHFYVTFTSGQDNSRNLTGRHFFAWPGGDLSRPHLSERETKEVGGAGVQHFLGPIF